MTSDNADGELYRRWAAGKMFIFITSSTTNNVLFLSQSFAHVIRKRVADHRAQKSEAKSQHSSFDTDLYRRWSSTIGEVRKEIREDFAYNKMFIENLHKPAAIAPDATPRVRCSIDHTIDSVIVNLINLPSIPSEIALQPCARYGFKGESHCHQARYIDAQSNLQFLHLSLKICAAFLARDRSV